MMTVLPSATLLLASGGFTDVDFQLTLWTIVLFGVFAFVLKRFGWKPLLDLIEEREQTVQAAVEGAEKANQEAQTLLEKHRELVRDAGREREQILKRALEEAERVREEAVGRAREQSERLLQRAKEQVARERSLAVQELRQQVADIAVQAASKIVESSLSPEAQRKLASDFIETLPKVH